MPRHAEKRLVPFRPDQMFELVADVDNYPKFVPWCVGARIRQRQHEFLIADLMIGYKVFRERFTSRVALNRGDSRIDVECVEGPFRYLKNHWVFESHGDGCLIDFRVEFEFRSSLLQGVIRALFTEAVHRTVRAFETRAHAIYGHNRPHVLPERS